MKRKFITVYLLFIFHYIYGVAYSQDLSTKEILRHADRSRGNIGGIIWDVRLSSSEKKSAKSYTLTVKAKGNNSLAAYTKPAKMKGRILLMKGRNMWFVRKGLRKPVPISPRQRLIGSASNADIASTNYVADYIPTLTGEEKIGGEACYVIDLKSAYKTVSYDRIKYWVSKDRLVGVMAEFYTSSGKLFKTARFKYDHEIKIGDKDTVSFVSEMTIKSAIKTDETTTLSYSDIKIENIHDSVFNLNVLLR